MSQALRKDCPRHIGDRGVALLASAEVAGIYGFLQFRQGFGSASDLILGSRCLGAVAVGLKHWIDPLWDSVLIV